jgi:hypothetical protein
MKDNMAAVWKVYLFFILMVVTTEEFQQIIKDFACGIKLYLQIITEQ